MIQSRYLFMLMLSSCSSGLIPCPEPTSSLIFKKNKNPKIIETTETTGRHATIKVTREKYTQHVTVEDWDCPRSDTRKYLPKSVKKNIKQNFQKIQLTNPDSLQIDNKKK